MLPTVEKPSGSFPNSAEEAGQFLCGYTSSINMDAYWVRNDRGTYGRMIIFSIYILCIYYFIQGVQQFRVSKCHVLCASYLNNVWTIFDVKG
jgi:hypothetical protein